MAGMTRRQLFAGAAAALWLTRAKAAVGHDIGVVRGDEDIAKTGSANGSGSRSAITGVPAIVDAHIHLWDLKALTYPWLTSKYDETSVLGPYRKICRNYLIPNLRADTEGLPLQSAVHVNAAVGHPDSVEETSWVQAHADQHGLQLAIIAGADLASGRLRQDVERHSHYRGFRGIRMITFGRDRYAEPEVLEGLRVLQAADLVCDVDVSFPQFGSIERAARMYPSLRLIVEHAGTPTRRSSDYFNAWHAAMRSLAAADNVACKISGLGIYDHSWTMESVKPWVLGCIDVFGTNRCLLSSNWPVDSLYSTYRALYVAYASLTEAFSDEERARLFGGNARRWYGLPQWAKAAAITGYAATKMPSQSRVRQSTVGPRSLGTIEAVNRQPTRWYRMEGLR
jgi:predicted TIM-barrel fold metal-dependent hydrolase